MVSTWNLLLSQENLIIKLIEILILFKEGNVKIAIKIYIYKGSIITNIKNYKLSNKP